MLDEGPLDELAFWAGRAADLGGVRSQLTDPGLLRVVKALEAAKSPYLPAFLSLGEDIQRVSGSGPSGGCTSRKRAGGRRLAVLAWPAVPT